MLVTSSRRNTRETGTGVIYLVCVSEVATRGFSYLRLVEWVGIIMFGTGGATQQVWARTGKIHKGELVCFAS